MKRGEETAIGKMETIIDIDDIKMDLYPNKFKFDIEKMSPMLSIPEGSLRMASKKNWPVLENSELELIK
jgi:hypothetical protein